MAQQRGAVPLAHVAAADKHLHAHSRRRGGKLSAGAVTGSRCSSSPPWLLSQVRPGNRRCPQPHPPAGSCTQGRAAAGSRDARCPAAGGGWGRGECRGHLQFQGVLQSCQLGAAVASAMPSSQPASPGHPPRLTQVVGSPPAAARHQKASVASRYCGRYRPPSSPCRQAWGQARGQAIWRGHLAASGPGAALGPQRAGCSSHAPLLLGVLHSR